MINITTPLLGAGGPPADPHAVTGSCSQYLVKAQVELRAEDPVPDPQGPSQATYLKYVN